MAHSVDIGQALIGYLKTKAVVTDLIGSGVAARIYENIAKQTVPSPFIIFRVFQLLSEEHLGGISGLAANRIELNCYAATSGEAFALAEAVRYSPLQMFRGPMMDQSGTTNAWVTAVTSDGGYERDFDPPTQGGNQKRYWVQRDYSIYYYEPIEES
jgi:hypothetical protein